MSHVTNIVALTNLVVGIVTLVCNQVRAVVVAQAMLLVANMMHAMKWVHQLIGAVHHKNQSALEDNHYVLNVNSILIVLHCGPVTRI